MRLIHRHPQRRRGEAAFTMVEIALSIAVVAFAMVAILGVLPTGLQVQKDNREETIINADGTYILETIRSGYDRAGLLDDAIYMVSVNYRNGKREIFSAPNNQPLSSVAPRRDWDPQWLVGLLSTPKSLGNQGVSNVVVWARALNNTAIDRDAEARDTAFKYRMLVEVEPTLAYPPALTNSLGTNDYRRVINIQQGLHEVRLTMQWPLFNDQVTQTERAQVGTHRRTFRTQIGGSQRFFQTNVLGSDQILFYFQPSLY
jgi:type II secretory pathway pseudopilin PulG